VTQFLPEGDRISESRRKLLGDIATLYGGRIAEEMMYGVEGVSTGAYQDIKMATSIARAMVVNYGLSDKLGPLDYDAKDDDYMGGRKISSHTQRLIDEEVKVITDDCYGRAKTLLRENEDVLIAMKNALMEFETLDSDQVADLMARRKVRPPRAWRDSDTGGAQAKDEIDDRGAVGEPAEEV
jgi:cell division protease FtsH